MKLNPDDVEEIDNAHPIELFRGINDDETLSGYTSILKNALCTALEDVLHDTHEERAAEFVKIGKEDPVTARSIILHLVMMWREQARLEPSDSEYVRPGTIRVNLNPIKKLMDMNDVACQDRTVRRLRTPPAWRSHQHVQPGRRVECRVIQQGRLALPYGLVPVDRSPGTVASHQKGHTKARRDIYQAIWPSTRAPFRILPIPHQSPPLLQAAGRYPRTGAAPGWQWISDYPARLPGRCRIQRLVALRRIRPMSCITWALLR